MENAAPLFGLAAMLFGVGFVVRSVAAILLRARERDRELAGAQAPGAAAAVSPALLAALEERLARIEHAVDATAVEVERLAESQRYAARLLANGAPEGGAGGHRDVAAAAVVKPRSGA